MFTKSMTIQLKAGPGDELPDGIFVGYASIFNVVDSVGDYVLPTAFDKSLADWEKSGCPIPILHAHNTRDPFANLGHVLQYEVDAAGLKVTGQLDLENPHALQVYRLLKGKRINQMSFAYDEIDSGPGVHDGRDVWELRELKLHEVSIVQVGANQETEILAVKSIPNVAARALRDIEAGRVLSSKNEGELRSAHDAIGKVLSALDSTEENVGKSASGEDPPRQPLKEAAREASQTPSVGAANAIDPVLLDIELLEGAVA